MELNSLFEDNPQPMWIYDVATLAFLYVNNSAIQHYGFSREEFLSMTIKDIRPKSDLPALEKFIDKSFPICSKSGEWRHIKKNGEIIFVEITSCLTKQGGKDARHVMIKDITDRIITAKELEDSRQQLKDIINSLPDATLVVDKDKKVIVWNRALEEMTGLAKEDIVGKSNFDYGIPFYGKSHTILLDVIDESNRVLTSSYTNLNKQGASVSAETFAPALYNGTGAHVSIKVSALFNNDGQRIGSIQSIRDISDKKLVEEELLKLKKAIFTSGEVIILTDTMGVFTFVNPAFTSLYGFSSEEIIGKYTMNILNSGKHDPSMFKLLWQTLLKGDEFRCELINKSKQGEHIDIDSSATPIIDENNKIIGFLCIQRDATYRKRTEQELIKSKEKAEESDRLKSAFLANMSHEIRTPMNGVLGFLELLKEPDIAEESKKEYIELVNISGQRLLETINDIIEISKIESGELPVRYSKVNIEEVMQYYLNFFMPQAKQKALEIKIKGQLTGVAAVVSTDRHKIDGILTNLIRNAVKFTSRGSIEFGNYIQNGHLVFYVKDTGKGIPDGKLTTIFKRFMQADTDLRRMHEGTGLGLSIAKAYVEVLGGVISVKSEVDKGSTFEFSIPYKPVSTIQEAVSNDKLSGSSLKGQTILVAEDDDISYLYLSKILEREGIKLIRAINGMDAIKLTRDNPGIPLILMDIKMPLMDGLEATRNIRQFNESILIIAQTANTMSGDEEKALEAGCNGYLSKPINSEKLMAMLEKMVKRHSA